MFRRRPVSFTRRARAAVATVLGVVIALNLLVLVELQRLVAEVDDEERSG